MLRNPRLAGVTVGIVVARRRLRRRQGGGLGLLRRRRAGALGLPRLRLRGLHGGREQSPVDLAGAQAAELPGVETDYEPSRATVVNNGHSVEVELEDGGSVRIGDTAYELVQFHFHAPSEHTIDGRSFPLEAHLVHKSADGRLAVIGLTVEEGAANAALDDALLYPPSHEGDERELADALDATDLLPADLRAYRYPGSLTTPPCSEGVSWLVVAEPVQLSRRQIAAFTTLYPANARPVQPLHGRTISLG